jgi:predicted nucleic-acid-binding protein
VRAVDTNVLVRLIARDEPAQTDAAEAFVAGGAWVSHVVLAEVTRALDSVYGLARAQIATAVEMLLDHEKLVVQDADAVARAVAQLRRRPALGFSDCLVVEIARKAGHLPLGTFDRDLGKVDGAEQLPGAD